MRKRLYVLRHGNAQAFGYAKDELRELTELGVAEVKTAAKQFKSRSETLGAVFVSPFVRAQQTAKIFLAELDTSVVVETCPLITPEANKIEVATWLEKQPYESVLLVTHQPFAHHFVDYLAQDPLPLSFAMTTASIAAIEGEFFAGACCQLRWHASPT
ncbi:phosphohistidine phosphatase SixA [Marinomonas vulgaris]|nr:phosphohistidine phosphatase SixA [Marinomonas vulgaris]